MRIDDAVDPVLRELRRRSVDPVVASLLSADEVEELSVHWGEGGEPGDVWVRLVARGELFQDLLSSSAWEGASRAGPAVLAERLADHLEDWLFGNLPRPSTTDRGRDGPQTVNQGNKERSDVVDTVTRRSTEPGPFDSMMSLVSVGSEA